MLKKALNYLLFSGVSSATSFLATIYMARTLSQESVGIIGLFMTIIYIAPQLMSFSSIGLVSINKVKLKHEDYIKFSNYHISFSLLNCFFLLLRQ